MSKIVYLKRAKPFVHEAINSEAMQEQLSLTHRSIGSYSSKSSPRGTGLTPEEEKILFPSILGMDATHVEFSGKVKDYYINIVTKIPGGNRGRELNIGLEDDSKPLNYKNEKGEYTNLPENVIDFITYRHAICYPFTAPSVEAMQGNPTIQYYIEDPTKVINSKFQETEIKDKAMTEYLKVKSDPEKVNMLLSVLKSYIRKQPGKPPVNLNNVGEQEKIILLSDLASYRPEKFYEFATNQDLKKRYFIEECCNSGIITRTGNMFQDREDSMAPLGETVNEVLAFLWNQRESSRLNRLKASYDSYKTRDKIIA